MVAKKIKYEFRHFDILGLKILWGRVHHWYSAFRGEGNIGGMTQSHARKGFRRFADSCWDRFERAAEKVLRETAVVTGPEVERDKYRNKPPKPGDDTRKAA